ncbi:MAG: alpha/beta hydrolase [Betaproteobacteria bacterium]|nr:MAG: alpha/beta hydrolase [Betaproteobacteria bacterium]
MAEHCAGSTAPAAEPVDRFVTVGGLRIHYVDWTLPGQESLTPLVLLHGIGRLARSFDPIVPHFHDRYRVIAMDMRGHGDSDWDPQARYLVEDYVQDLEGLVEQLGLHDIVLWGNSTGGRVAQVFAGTHPELTRAVIVEDVGPERPKEVSARRGQRMAREQQGWASIDELLATLKSAYPRTPEATLRAFATHNCKPRGDGRIVLKRDPDIEKGFVPTELWRFVKTIRAPIIYVLGGASSIVPAETQQELRRILPQVEIVTMPGLGHYPYEEDPAAFAAIVARFLAALPPR